MGDDAAAGFGKVLRRLRRAAGLTQEELAARAGLSARGVADLERGARRTPRRDTVALLVAALDASPPDEAALLAAARRPAAPTDAAARPSADDDDQAASAPSQGDQARHNLPYQPTQLLGRSQQLAALTTLLRRADVRLVTLTGPGGIGKTRLAIQVATELVASYPDGAWFVRLSRLVEPGLALPMIAQTLGLAESGSQPIADTLRAYLADKRLLLVLDNFEQIVAASAEVATLLEASPGLNLLVTSRLPLRLRGEREYPLAPLALPDPRRLPPTDELSQVAAVALFVERAQGARPDFALTADNAPVVAELCARLDGLPLAIELAAARIKLLPPRALLARLSTHSDLLSSGARDVDERQQAMRNTLAWSENLLSAEERTLFRRLAIFVGGCALESAAVVCVAPEGAAPLEMNILDGLSALVDHSLIYQRAEGDEARFGMLHVVREYALAGLMASGEMEALRRAHAAALLALATQAETGLTGPDAGAWADRLEREHDNLRAALSWARERGETDMGLRLAASIFRFWMVRGHLREGRSWLESLLALEPGQAPAGADATQARARALLAAGVLAVYQGDNAAAGAWLAEAMTVGRRAGDRRTEARALNMLGVMAMNEGDLELARPRLEESLALIQTVGERRDVAVALTNLGIAVYAQHDLARAANVFTEALALGRQLGERDMIATNLSNLSSVALRQGDIPQAETLQCEALALYQALGDPRRCAVGLEGLASTAGMARQGERAARLLGAAEALRETLGAPIPPPERADVERAVAEARAALGEEAWGRALAAGRALTLEQAIAEALDMAQTRQTS